MISESVAARVRSLVSVSSMPPLSISIPPSAVMVASFVNLKLSAPPPLLRVNLPPISKALAPLPLKVICPPEALPKVTAPVTPTDPPPPIWGTVKSTVPDPAVALICKEVRASVSPIFPPKVKVPVPEARIK